MSLISAAAAGLPAVPQVAAALAAFAPAHTGSHVLPVLLRLGLVGVFLVSIVDSSFVPLPIPGVTDIMIILFAAQHANWILLVLIATAGSALGGYLSFQIAQAGGMQFLQKHVPERLYRRVTGWMESHAILSVALPAILPPPMPLAPFVLAAGAARMSRSKFMYAFTISRLARHAIAAWLGIHYGRGVLRIWSHFSSKWAATILSVIWAIILVGVGIAFWKLYKISREMKKGGSQAAGSPSEAPAG